ncbi:MAG: LOG family protein [Candidatus Acidiferrales bacterium]
MKNARPSAKTITVFGSSRPREGDSHYALAQQLGAQLAARGFTVCNGGYGGVMEAVSRGAKDAGGRTLGITAEFFNARANAWVDEIISVKTWQERLFALIERGSGYVACPGGTGTLVELAVVWEMLNKRVMPAKPFVTIGHFWQPIIERVREVEIGHASSWGEAAERLIYFAPDPAHAADYLASKLSPNAHARS